MRKALKETMGLDLDAIEKSFIEKENKQEEEKRYMNFTNVMQSILDEHDGVYNGRRYFIDDETLFRIEGNRGVEVLYLDGLTRMDIRPDMIIFYEDDYKIIVQ